VLILYNIEVGLYIRNPQDYHRSWGFSFLWRYWWKKRGQ